MIVPTTRTRDERDGVENGFVVGILDGLAQRTPAPESAVFSTV